MSHRVLIIEDDPTWLKIFQVMIGEQIKDIFEYVNVGTLAEALIIMNQGFDLILLDLMLPDSDAHNTLKVMTSKVTMIPIVVITTLDDEKLIHEAFLLGAEDYLVKDKYELETFIHVCRQAIARFMARQERDVKSILDNLRSLDEKLKNFSTTLKS